MTSKAMLRYQARNRPHATARESGRICAHLQGWLAERIPAVVLSYLPLPGEVDLGSLHDAVGGATWALTRTPEEGPLTIHTYEAKREFHRFGFSQPVASAPAIDDAAVGIVLLPGLCFDRFGARLGRGMGYYDELLGRLGPEVESVGVALDAWIVDEVPVEPHDRMVGWLVTESGIRRTGAGAVPE